MFQTIAEVGKPYGPVFTMFLGTMPSVIITSLEAGQEAFRDRKIDFAGRQVFGISM